ncbi:baseplate assembly protein, partial [Alteromonas sp. a30]|nr:baseplate assembly protein [Alteromonas sp. a30]
LHQSGVQNVQLTAPTQNIINAANEAAFCSGIDIVLGGTDA